MSKSGYPQFSNINDEYSYLIFWITDSEAVDSLVLAYNRLSDEFGGGFCRSRERLWREVFTSNSKRKRRTIVYRVFYTGPEDGSLPQEALYSTPINDKYEGQLEDSDFLSHSLGDTRNRTVVAFKI